MGKVRTFSRKFPDGHIHQGHETFFVEKILNEFCRNYFLDDRYDFRERKYLHTLYELNNTKLEEGKITETDLDDFYYALSPQIQETKKHTIRTGYNLKVGDKISPRIWTSKPYYSPQIIIAEDIEVKYCPEFYRTPEGHWLINKNTLTEMKRKEVSGNDGLSYLDMNSWFNKEFSGQIICWSDTVKYDF